MRLILADDAVFFRESLAGALTAVGHDVVGQAGDVAGLLELVTTVRPDVAIIDIRMPPTGTTEGLDATVRIRALDERIGIVLLSNAIETRHVDRLLRDAPGGIGYLLKDRVGRSGRIPDAVRRVAAGGSVVDPEVVATLLGRARPHGPLDELTPRERDVLCLMAEGRSNLAIAERLGLTERPSRAMCASHPEKLGLEPADEDIVACWRCYMDT